MSLYTAVNPSERSAITPANELPQPSRDYRRAIAARNVDAVLDAAEALLDRGSQVSITAVAAKAGLSRVTVYAHFATLEALLEAVVERAVIRTMALLDEADLERGSPVDALERLIAVAWRELDRNRSLARAAAQQLSPTAMARAHEAAHRRIGELLERGRSKGAFRTDLPADWLVTCALALVHACGDEVRAGRMDAEEALDVLTRTIRDLVVGPKRG